MSDFIGNGKPINISKTVWYYEYPGTLHFIVECHGKNGSYHQTLNFRVPVPKLKASLARIARETKKDKR